MQRHDQLLTHIPGRDAGQENPEGFGLAPPVQLTGLSADRSIPCVKHHLDVNVMPGGSGCFGQTYLSSTSNS